MKQGDHLFLVDGSAYIFRAYHALPPLTRKSDGLPVGAVSGFVNMLQRYIEGNTGANAATHVAVIFDKGSHTFRNDLYDLYKANRDAMPEDLRPQMPLTRTATQAFNIACKEKEGFEADDIIASLCIYNNKKEVKEPMLILSADKDFIQLHRYETVKQYDPIRNRWIETDNPVMYLQEHIIRGDRSDGIPNILTCDDAIVSGKVQKKMSKEKITTLATMDPEEFTNFIRLRNWKRNSELIDFREIPESVVERILTSYIKFQPQTSVNIDYFIENKLQDILDEFS